jgi:uncharacterized membrane protein
MRQVTIHQLGRRGTMKRVSLGVALAALLGTSAWAQSRTINDDDPRSASEVAYSFKTIVFPGDTFTQLLGINKDEKIAGYHGSGATGHPNKGFVLTLPNYFDPENFPGSMQTQVIGINDLQHTDGFYIDSAGNNHGFFHFDNTFLTVDFPGTTFNQLLGLNNLDQAAGYYADALGIDHPYVVDRNGGVFMALTIPNATGGGQATGINDRGSISGFFIDGGGVTHGFLLAEGELVQLDFPDATLTQALGLNDLEEVVGGYTDAAGLSHGFVYRKGHFQSVDDPDGIGTTTINGVNGLGRIVGFYVDSQGNTDGLVGTPQD